MKIFSITLFLLAFLFIIIGFNNPLCGNWQMCKHQTGNITRVVNVCTKFEFDKNGEGRIIFPGYKCDFAYKVNNTEVIFSFKTKTEKESFISKDTVLQYEFNKEKQGLLILKEKSGEQIFFLAK